MSHTDFPYFNIQRSQFERPMLILSCEVPVKDRAEWTNLGAIRVSYEQQENGLPAKGVYGSLVKIEDAVVAALGNQILHIGHILYSGCWTIIFASKASLPPEVSAKASLLSTKRKYSIEQLPGWAWYDREMAPSPLDKERTASLELLDKLHSLGDQPDLVRPVDFAALYPSDALREAFLSEVLTKGFRMGGGGKWEPESNQAEFWCEIVFDTSIEADTIAAVCLEVRAIAEKFGGTFDGWCTPVMRG